MLISTRQKSWDEYFIHIAEEVATRSKDNQTKVGVVLVKENKLLSTGYNGAPKQFPDTLVPDCTDQTKPLKEQKYSYICHAELNAILNYYGSVQDLEGATVYTTIFPCHDCAKMLIQAGIKRVVYKEMYHRENISEMSRFLFDTCGVQYYQVQ